MNDVSPLARAALTYVASRKRGPRQARRWTDAYDVGRAVFPNWMGATTKRTDAAIQLLAELARAGLVECSDGDLGNYNAKWRVVKEAR